MWKLLKPFICKGTSKSSDPIRVKWNGSVISDPKVLANHFNDYFIDTVDKAPTISVFFLQIFTKIASGSGGIDKLCHHISEDQH